MPEAQESRRLGIADVIEAVHEELIESQKRREQKGREALFTTKQLELELSFAVERESGAEGKVSFWVVELGGGGKVNSSEIQKIKLTLDTSGIEAHRDAGRPEQERGAASDDRPEISGVAPEPAQPPSGPGGFNPTF